MTTEERETDRRAHGLSIMDNRCWICGAHALLINIFNLKVCKEHATEEDLMT